MSYFKQFIQNSKAKHVFIFFFAICIGGGHGLQNEKKGEHLFRLPLL